MDVTLLAEQLATALSATRGTPVTVEALTRMPGGASRETWSFTAREPDGAGTRLVLRRDPPGAPESGLRLEAALLRAAAQVEVPVPRVVATGDPAGALGATYMVMEFVDGETIPRRILRDAGLDGARRVLAAQCGHALAAIHRIPAGRSPASSAVTPWSSSSGCSTGWASPTPPSSSGCGGWPRPVPPRRCRRSCMETSATATSSSGPTGSGP